MDIPVPNIFQSLACHLTRHDRSHRADVRRAAAVQLVSLPMNGTVSVERPHGCRVQCARGSAWITHIGDGRDIVFDLLGVMVVFVVTWIWQWVNEHIKLRQY